MLPTATAVVAASAAAVTMTSSAVVAASAAGISDTVQLSITHKIFFALLMYQDEKLFVDEKLT